MSTVNNRKKEIRIQIREVIKKQLNDIGERIYNEAKMTTRIQYNPLVNSVNYGVKPYNRLTLFHLHYGKYNRPKGKNSGPYNALRIAARRHTPKGTTVLIKEMKESILYRFKK